MTPSQPSLAFCICGDESCSVPYGECHCRCGKKAKISPQTDRALGYIKGQPRRFLAGHSSRVLHVLEDAAPFKIDGVYCRLISINKGQYVIVDAEDYLIQARFTWGAGWSKCTRSYYAMRTVVVNDIKTTIYMHREIFGLAIGNRSRVDHRNGVTLDNRRKNLRPATPLENSRNCKKRRNTISGLKGVGWVRNIQKWQARIRVNGKLILLGYFDTKEEAYAAYCEAATFYFGEFARFA